MKSCLVWYEIVNFLVIEVKIEVMKVLFFIISYSFILLFKWKILVIRRF